MHEQQYYELSELIDEANRLRERDRELADTTPFNSRTVSYYVQEELLPRSGRRGPGTRYTQDFLYRLLLIRRLQKEQALTLADIRETMKKVSPQVLKAVALGKERIAIKPVHSPSELEKYEVHDEEVLLLRDQDQAPRPKDARVHEHSMPYTGAPEKRPVHVDSKARKHRLPLGRDAELIVNKTITAKQARQLQHIAHLIKDILDEGNEDNI